MQCIHSTISCFLQMLTDLSFNYQCVLVGATGKSTDKVESTLTQISLASLERQCHKTDISQKGVCIQGARNDFQTSVKINCTISHSDYDKAASLEKGPALVHMKDCFYFPVQLKL